MITETDYTSEIVMDDHASKLGCELSEVVAARDRFFPGWWTYVGQRFLLDEHKPFYRVTCRDIAEAELAQEVQPDFIRAEIVLVDQQSSPRKHRRDPFQLRTWA